MCKLFFRPHVKIFLRPKTRSGSSKKAILGIDTIYFTNALDSTIEYE